MLKESIEAISKIKDENIKAFANLLLDASFNRIWVCGNGGSASCASHFNSDLLSQGFNVTCLNDNMSRCSALTNDYGWDTIYEKQLEYLKPNDLLILISVHGGQPNWSNNLVKAANFAKLRKGKVLSLLGYDGGELAKISDFCIIVPANNVGVVEGVHCVLTHEICRRLNE